MNSLAARFLVQANEFREVNMLEKNAIITLSIPQWVMNQLGEDVIVLLNLENIHVDVHP